jgi:hypothetical protein
MLNVQGNANTEEQDNGANSAKKIASLAGLCFGEVVTVGPKQGLAQIDRGQGEEVWRTMITS